ncbi:MAG: PQQ-binding-like beta-propeller repeat protein [Planctomycetota bacterium]
MMRQKRTRRSAIPTLCAGLTCVGITTHGLTTVSRAAEPTWPQFGGPDRNFMVKASGLAEKWPEAGPKQLWKRELGDGYATVVSDGERLYTMYRVENDEFAVALDAKTGKTVWEQKNASPFTKEMAEFGPGPHATPLIAGAHVYTIGTNAVMHCFEKTTGKIVWMHDLPAEFKAPVPGRGYGASPIVYKNTVIVVVDRERPQPGPGDAADKPKENEKPAAGQSLMAFDLLSGSPVWKSLDLEMSYASPILIKFKGQEQLVLFTANELAGVNPNDGSLYWTHPHKTQYGANLSTPAFNGQDLLFCSAAYDSGSQVVQLAKEGDKTVAKELWFGKKMRLHHGNPIVIDDHVYGSSGDFGPAFFMGLDIKTGKVDWRERGFSKATCVAAGDKIIILDEDGNLALATLTPQALTVLGKTKIAEKYAWAAPTLVGKTLYVRDRKNVMAFDLGGGN